MSKLLAIIFCFWSTIALSQIQKIQWASRLDYQFNQYSDSQFSATQVLGPPDAFPPGTLSKNALRLQGDASYGTVVVGFKRPQQVTQLVVVENNRPGRIVQIKLIDEKGAYYIIFQGEAQDLDEDFRTMVLNIPRTSYRVQAVQIDINSIAQPGPSQIDAIGLLDEADMADVRNFLAGANFNVQQVMSFTAKKVMLSDKINSKFAEAKPLVSHDGNTLYFSRMFYPGNYAGRSDPQDIYYSRKLNGVWSAAMNIGAPLNDQYANGVCSISPDGKTLLLINGYEPNGVITAGVSISRKTISGWGKPHKLNIENYQNTGEFQDFFLSIDESVLLMAVQRHDGYGQQDLYVSIKDGPESYSKPKNLGMAINTSMAEFAPFLSPDNTTLYFASEGHGGYGQSDIFKSKRLDNSWQSWSTPENLGPSVNTSSWEAYFSITAAGDYAYFVSSEGSHDGSQNIYRIPLLQQEMPESPEPMLAFQGKVFDASTSKPVDAYVVAEETKHNVPYRTQSDGLSGNFLVYIPRNPHYSLSVKAKGYISIEENMDVTPYLKDNQISRNIYLKPISTDQIFTVNNLQFEQSKATLLDQSIPTLQRLVQIMTENPDMRIELAGHTDAYGPAEAKKALSLARVERVKDYLVDAGIDKNRIETVGYGSSHPIAPNNTEENRAKNRRVEIKILDVGYSRNN